MFRMLIALGLLPVAGSAATQIERGEALYFDASKGCATCHALKGRGTAIGPDLKTIARISPRAVAMAVRTTATQYVQAVKLKSGETFPGMPGAKDDNVAQYYDLSKMPPELRKLAPADIESTRNNEAWKHPPAQGYTNEELADVVAFVRYAFAGDKSPVAPADVQ